MTTNVPRVTGNAVSAAAASFVAHAIQLPHGIPEGIFKYCLAPGAAIAGYETGRWLGYSKKRQAIIGSGIAIFVLPLCVIWYLYLMSKGDGGFLAVAQLVLAFVGVTYSFFCVMGVLGVKMFEQKPSPGGRGRQKPPDPPTQEPQTPSNSRPEGV